MIGRRLQTLLILGAAVGAHALLAALMVRTARWHDSLGPYPVAVTTSDWVIPQAEDAPPIQPLPPDNDEPEPAPELPSPDALGEANGTGDSIASSDLPDVSRSTRAFDFEQAWTRQQPTVLPPPPSRQADRPAEQADDRPQDQTPNHALASAEQAATALPFGALPKPAKPDDSVADGNPEPQAQPPVQSVEPVAEPASAIKPEQTPAPEARSPTQATEARPVPQGQSDLDAFAREEGADFTPGGMKARAGREVKLARPRINLAFMADATALYGRGLRVLMMIETDANGRPRNVTVIESSGSEVIDNAVRVAAFDSWFGPPMSSRFAYGVHFPR